MYHGLINHFPSVGHLTRLLAAVANVAKNISMYVFFILVIIYVGIRLLVFESQIEYFDLEQAA